ncbi:MAG: calcium-translocating P-type ATPase, PMCA-type [Lachnospirales bacterium]
MKEFFEQSSDEALKSLSSNGSTGLSSSDAKERLGKYGENKLEGKKEKTIFQLFLDQFKDFLVIILMVAAIISIVLGHIIDGFAILAIVILNACLGVYQENKASNALKALQAMASPKTKVLRDGVFAEIPSEEVVPGDIVQIDAGDKIPADMRLIESANMKVDESALTGESVATEKDSSAILESGAGVGDRINCIFSGSVVTYGRGKAVVTHTGMDTQMGKIAGMLNDSDDETTPLQKKLNSLGKTLGIVCIIVCCLIFGLGVLRGDDIFEIFMTAVSLAVAAVPEGLTVVVTVVLSMGMQKMVKSNAIIKRLSAVETLGSTTVICSDKTGTLTQNKMTVIKMFDTNTFYEVSGTGYGAEGEIKAEDGQDYKNNVEQLIIGAALCNDSIYDDKAETIIGDPTEAALLVLAKKIGHTKDELNTAYPRINEFPFDSDRKLMSTFHKVEDKVVMYTKGAPDEVLRRTTKIYKNGEIRDITEEEKSEIAKINQGYGEAALRVLAVAFRNLDNDNDPNNQEKDLVFLGLLSMIDPPREEAKEAIKICKAAGIGVKMITGDHKITASAIGAELGIITETGAVEGRELDSLSDDELKEVVKKTNVFARVSPEHKVRLVSALRSNGEIVSMTGDGVNDAPSLKRADIGVAMGITGTDVSKEAADMILTDDNFASIVKAVEEGRTIFNNIRKVVAYLLSCNIGEILVIFLAMLFNWSVPLASIQLLLVNLITDAFPAFALGVEKKEDDVMAVHPRNPQAPIVDKKMLISIAFQSTFLALGTLGSFYYGFTRFSYEEAVTLCFVTLVLGELLRSFSARSEKKSIFKMNVFENGFLNKTVLASLTFLLIVVYVPFLNPIFSTIPLAFSQIGVAALFALLPLAGGEIAKVFK